MDGSWDPPQRLQLLHPLVAGTAPLGRTPACWYTGKPLRSSKGLKPLLAVASAVWPSVETRGSEPSQPWVLQS